MDTRSIQTILLKNSYDLGKWGADGDFGPMTIKAVKAFQTAKGLPVTGKADEQTVKALQASVADKPAVKPLPPVPGYPFATPKATRKINEIIVHCTATPEGRDVSVATIRGWHKANGWSDIGYHWVILLDGTIQPGRPENVIGSHVAGKNTGTLGVVYVGGTDAKGNPKDTRTPAQKAALLAHVKALIARYPGVIKVSGHNQYAAKACPSFDVRKDPLGQIV